MRLPQEVNLPLIQRDNGLNYALKVLFRQIAQKVNALADGSLTAIDNAYTAAPTTGTWARGDFVRNSEPAEAGSANSKYVIFGWLCVTAGTPGTWVECRFLTGA